MAKTIIAILITTVLALPPTGATKAKKAKDEWKQIENCRITTYCPVCNDGAGHESSSGVELRYGHAACRWLPIGTKVSIEGEIFEIVDTCGTDAIDIFLDTDDTICRCNLNDHKTVMVKKTEEINEQRKDRSDDHQPFWWRVFNKAS